MSNQNQSQTVEIGLRLANGSFYPIFGENFRGSKKLLLTTVHDNQQSVQIDLYKGIGQEIFEDAYIGSLVLENLPALAKGAVEIELFIGIDSEGNLHASASEKSSGEKQSLDVSLETLSGRANYEMPDLELEPALTVVSSQEAPATLTGETYPVTKEDRRRTHLAKKGSSAKAIILIIILVLGLAGLAVAGYFLYPHLKGFVEGLFVNRSTFGPSSSSARASTSLQAQASSSSSVTSSESSSSEQTPGERGTWYTVVKGDTLWDLARQYYRDPFQYLRIANAPQNNIKNPDLILEKQKLYIPAP